MKHHIMVTSFQGHWDRITNNYTGFSAPMLKFRLEPGAKPEAELPVIFVKRQKDGPVEKAWSGKVSYLEKKPYKDISKWWFNVHLEQEIDCPEDLKTHKEGWYIEERASAHESSKPSQAIEPQHLYDPPFISRLESTTSWREFEDYTYDLLRISGINEIHRFDPANQSGKADGLFKIGKTVIIYDCTLEQNFEKRKSAQITNYSNLLNSNIIELEDRTMNITNCEKFVWIIVRDNHEQPKMKQADDVMIKVLSINSLIDLYRKRMKQHWNEKHLEREIQEL